MPTDGEIITGGITGSVLPRCGRPRGAAGSAGGRNVPAIRGRPTTSPPAARLQSCERLTVLATSQGRIRGGFIRGGCRENPPRHFGGKVSGGRGKGWWDAGAVSGKAAAVSGGGCVGCAVENRRDRGSLVGVVVVVVENILTGHLRPRRRDARLAVGCLTLGGCRRLPEAGPGTCSSVPHLRICLRCDLP